MNLSQLQGEEKLLLRRFEDMQSISGARYTTKFSPFLTERGVQIAQEYIKQNRLANAMLYGGRPEAARQVLGMFAESAVPCARDFPITGITVRFAAHAVLSHRDFLGALMALKIARESIGDILLSPGRCDLFVSNPVAATILDELAKVGSVGVKCMVAAAGDYVVLEQFEEIRGTISSARIDSLVGMLTKLSREKAAELITQGKVQRNWQQVANGAREFVPEDTFSIRGFGRFVVEEIGAPTKKGRLPVRCRKYI